jgi:hypothetical protein
MNTFKLVLKGIANFVKEAKFVTRSKYDIGLYFSFDTALNVRLTEIAGMPVYTGKSVIKKVIAKSSHRFSEEYLDIVLLTEAALVVSDEEGEQSLICSPLIEDLMEDEIEAIFLEAKLLAEYEDVSMATFHKVHKEVDAKLCEAGYKEVMKEIVERLVHRHHVNNCFLSSLDHVNRLKNFA